MEETKSFDSLVSGPFLILQLHSVCLQVHELDLILMAKKMNGVGKEKGSQIYRNKFRIVIVFS